MERILERTLLFDFYGELLTPKQRDVFDMYVLNDFSMAEIAEKYGTTRQAVNDLLKRTEKLLAKYESRLGLLSRFLRTKDRIDQLIVYIEETPDFGKEETSALKEKLLELKDF